MTVREALAEASAAGTSALDASLLLAEVLNMSRSSLIAADSRPLTEVSLTAFRGLIKRRLDGECTAYILGRKEFYGLDFQVNPAVLVPRPDTETLVEAALEELGSGGREQLVTTNHPVRVLDCMRRTVGSETNTLPKQEPFRVLDLCTGCGAVAIALKHTMPELEVWAADISAEALAVAQANAARLLPPDSIHFCHGDLFEVWGVEIDIGKQSEFLSSRDHEQHTALPTPYSLIISNPPYVPSAEIAGLAPEVRREPLLALDGGDDGLEIIRRIISKAPQFLCHGGVLLLEADPRQMERMAVLLRQTGFTDIQTSRDLSGKERVIRGIKG